MTGHGQPDGFFAVAYRHAYAGLRVTVEPTQQDIAVLQPFVAGFGFGYNDKERGRPADIELAWVEYSAERAMRTGR